MAKQSTGHTPVETDSQQSRHDQVSGAVIRAAIAVHQALGPGLLESAYEACLVHEVRTAGSALEQQRPLPVKYAGVLLDCAYRLDLVVDGLVIVEVKAVEMLLPIHSAQLLSYLKLSGLHVGLLINFNVPQLLQGIKRIVNDYVPDRVKKGVRAS